MLDQMLREHPPGTMSLVHPMFGDVDYGPLDEFTRFTIVVDGKDQETWGISSMGQGSLIFVFDQETWVGGRKNNQILKVQMV